MTIDLGQSRQQAVADVGSLAVVSFSNSSSVAYPLTAIINDTNRNTAKAAVNALVAGGPTNVMGAYPVTHSTKVRPASSASDTTLNVAH